MLSMKLLLCLKFGSVQALAISSYFREFPQLSIIGERAKRARHL